MKGAKELVLAAWLSTVGCVSASYKTPEPQPVVVKEETKLPIKHLDDLVINTENKTRTVVNDSELAGVLKMRELLCDSNYEKGWVHLPSKSQWIEVGGDATPKRIEDGGYILSLEVDTDEISRLMKDQKEFIFYQIHPNNRKLLTEELKRIDPELSGSRLDFILNELGLLSALPSSNDVACMLATSLEYYKQNPEGNIKFKICSTHGVTDFSLTEKGREKYNSLLYVPVARMQVCSLMKRLAMLMNLETEDSARIKKYCENLSNDRIKIGFTPYEALTAEVKK